MRIIAILLAAVLMGCASAKTERIIKFKEITKDLCIDNPNEVLLAQHLYNQMVLKTN
tara:strand:- start:519 stop:689 length:171 start_codon:yes stop_codon:yes gene_type:complete